MATQHFKSLNRKIAIAVFSIAMIFAVLAAIISFMVELVRSQDKTEVMINQLLDTIEYSAAIAAYSNNQQIAKEVTQGLLRNDVIHKVQIKSDQGFLVEEERKTASVEGFIIRRQLVSPFNSQEHVGNITVNSDEYYNLAEAKHSALVNAINSFLLIALTTGIIFGVVRVNLTRPLTRVSDSLHAIIAGEKDRIAHLPNSKNDELGRLVLDINNLLDVIEGKFINERTLRQKIEYIEKQLRNIFESSSAGLFQLDQNGRLLTYNPTLMKVFNQQNLSEKDAVGQDFADLFFENPQHIRQMLQNALESEQLESNDFALNLNAGNSQRWVHCLLSKIQNNDIHARFEGVVFDITKRINTEQAIRYQAEYDSLTGLLRRPTAELQLKSLLNSATSQLVSVMILDLDGFKAINDVYGHDAGDQVLIEVAKRFKSRVRHQDIVARLGGDEFMIVLNQCQTHRVATMVAEKIIQAIQIPIRLNSGIEVNIGTSIGIAMFPEHGDDITSLFKSADEAMYEVKRQGKNGFVIKTLKSV